MEASPAGFVVITAAAALAPIASETVRRFRIPTVLFELLLGMLIGPQLLGWAEPTDFITAVSKLGLAFLMLMAGYEVDLDHMRGAPLRRASAAWVASLLVGLAVGTLLVVTDFALNDLLIGLALTTTALGVLLPMLRDRGLLATDEGRAVLAAGTLGEFGPIVAITLLLTGDNPAHEALLLVAFVLVALGAAWVSLRPQPPKVVDALHRHLHSSSQLPVRIAILLLSTMVLLAFELGLDTILGSFTAGMLLRLLRSPEQAEGLDPKLESIGFGFLIPIFFIVTGMNFDLDALADPSTLARVPLFLALFLVVRGLPALVVHRGRFGARTRVGLGVLQSTALPLVVVITEIGLQTGRMRPENATALVGAAMLSVLVFPLVGFALLGATGDDPPPSSTTGEGSSSPGDEQESRPN